MTKSELIDALSDRMDGLKQKEAEIIVNTIFSRMKKSLIQGERIEIRGFGSFKVKSYKAYSGRNPKTGQSIRVKPKRLPFFKVGKELKERVNSL